MAYKDRQTEINEAIQAGNAAISALNDAERYLSSARTWGFIDMFGGGLLSGLIKHSKLDEAERCMNRARENVLRFRDELEDVSCCTDIAVNFDTFSRVIDLFCDNILVDFMIQDKIAKSLQSVRDARSQIGMAMQKLAYMSSY